MNLIIDAELTNPPTEISVFRDITLYSKTFLNYDILLECDAGDRDIYYYWLKKRGAFDFIDDFVSIGEESGITIRSSNGTITINYLRTEQLNNIIYLLNKSSLYL